MSHCLGFIEGLTAQFSRDPNEKRTRHDPDALPADKGLTHLDTRPTFEHVSENDWWAELDNKYGNAPWFWRISLRDEHLVEHLGARSDYSTFALTESERDWHLKRLAGYSRPIDDYIVERVPGPYRRALNDDRARRERLCDEHWAKKTAEREARMRESTT